MRKSNSLLITTVVFALIYLGHSARADEPVAAVRDLSPLLETTRAKLELPALAALVVTSDGVVAQGVSGVRRLGDPTPAAKGDRWHLGSCTKAMTATMIGVLVERGALSWDTTIASAFPNLGKTTRDAYMDVTIEMLLQHRGRIGTEKSVLGLWDRLWERKGTPVEERRLMARLVLSQEPMLSRNGYHYSNYGYGIAGHMAETITGKPWEQLVKELVFEPLGMTTAGFGVPWSELPSTDPWPHRADGTVLTPGPMADNPPSIAPAGTVHASLEDWGKFIQCHLQGARGKDTVLLKSETYQRLHKGRQSGIGQSYAMGWVAVNRPWAAKYKVGQNGPCLTHTGSNMSWVSVVWIAPDRDFAVLVTTNVGGEGMPEKADQAAWAVIQDHLKTLGD